MVFGTALIVESQDLANVGGDGVHTIHALARSTARCQPVWIVPGGGSQAHRKAEA